jgi:hypothetical protein
MNRIDRPLLKIEVRRIGILFVVLPLILGFKNYAGDPYSSTSTDTALDACPTGAVTMSSGSLSIGTCTISGNISLSGSASVKVIEGSIVTVAGNLIMSDSAVFSVNNATLIFPKNISTSTRSI